MAQFFEEIVQEHRKTFDNGNIRDVVDAYLQEIEVAEEEGRTDELFEGKVSLNYLFFTLDVNFLDLKILL